jgi:hypothetical protein
MPGVARPLTVVPAVVHAGGPGKASTESKITPDIAVTICNFKIAFGAQIA